MKKYFILLALVVLPFFPCVVQAKETDLSNIPIEFVAGAYRYVSVNEKDWISFALSALPSKAPQTGFVVKENGSNNLFAYISVPKKAKMPDYEILYYGLESSCNSTCIELQTQTYYIVEINPENRTIISTVSRSGSPVINFTEIIQSSVPFYKVRSTTGEIISEERAYSSKLCMNVTDTFGDGFNAIRMNEVPSFSQLPAYSKYKYYTLVKSSNRFYFLYFTNDPLSVTYFQTACYKFFRLNLKNSSGVLPWDDPGSEVYMYNDTIGIANGWEKIVRNPSNYNYFDSYVMVPDRAFKNPDYDWGDEVLPYFNNNLVVNSKIISFSNWMTDTSVAYSISSNYDIKDTLTGKVPFPKDNIDFSGSTGGGNSTDGSNNNGIEDGSLSDFISLIPEYAKSFLPAFAAIGNIVTLGFATFPPIISTFLGICLFIIMIALIIKIWK